MIKMAWLGIMVWSFDIMCAPGREDKEEKKTTLSPKIQSPRVIRRLACFRLYRQEDRQFKRSPFIPYIPQDY